MTATDGIVVFGSLINKQQVSDVHVPLGLGQAVPVIVDGFRREFSQEPCWRHGEGEERAVLTVVENEGQRFNGILLVGLSEAVLALLDKREKGYTRKELEPSQVHPYDPFALPEELRHLYLYIGKPEQRNVSLLPNRSYLETCLEGARHWGEQFLPTLSRRLSSGNSCLRTS